jgi:hypothetical protein
MGLRTLSVAWAAIRTRGLMSTSASIEERFNAMKDCIDVLKKLNPQDQLRVWLCVNQFLALNSVHLIPDKTT